jgi:hypothetical protein
MPRTANPTRAASSKKPVKSNAGAPVVADALAFNVDVARNMFNSSLAAMQGWLECALEVQKVHSDTVKDLANVVTAAVDQTEHATSLSELLEVQRTLTAGQFMRAAQNYGMLVMRLSAVELRLMQQAQAAAASSTDFFRGVDSQLKGNGATSMLGSPLALWGSTQAAMADIQRQWARPMMSFGASRPA